MALDTEDERRGVPNIIPLVMLPLPDNDIDAPNRMQATYLYPVGAAPALPVEAITSDVNNVMGIGIGIGMGFK